MATSDEAERTDEAAPRLWADVHTTADEAGSTATVRDRFELDIDEPPWVPIGNDEAPCPGDYLLVATAGCQVEVLKQALEKARVAEYDIHLHVERTRDDTGMADAPEPFPAHTGIRYAGLEMTLTVETTPAFEDRVRRCLDVAEDACIVGRSVEAGIPIGLEKELQVTAD